MLVKVYHGYLKLESVSEDSLKTEGNKLHLTRYLGVYSDNMTSKRLLGATVARSTPAKSVSKGYPFKSGRGHSFLIYYIAALIPIICVSLGTPDTSCTCIYYGSAKVITLNWSIAPNYHINLFKMVSYNECGIKL